MAIALKIEDVSKMYRLGTVGTGTLSHDLNRYWAMLRGRPDPTLKIGMQNDRSQSGGDYVWALKDVNLEVQEGEILGIIGRNGAGKSTLLKLLSRVTAPTTGSIKAKGRIASLLEVGTGFHPELTGRENVYLNGAIMGMTRPEITKRLDEIVEFSGCAKYIDTPVKRYSSGMTVRLGFSVAAHLDCEILVVDEVLAVGDAEFRKRCIGKMGEVRNAGRTILFVSHIMESVRALCSRVVRMEQGKVIASGAAPQMIESYLEDRVIETKTRQLPRSAGDDLRIVDLSLSSANICTHDPLRLTLELHAVEQTLISEMALIFQTNSGSRAAIIDLRTGDNAISLKKEEAISLSASIESIPFVEGEYAIGLYVRSKRFWGNLNDLRLLNVCDPPSREDGFSKFPSNQRGVVELKSNNERVS